MLGPALRGCTVAYIFITSIVYNFVCLFVLVFVMQSVVQMNIMRNRKFEYYYSRPKCMYV